MSISLEGSIRTCKVDSGWANKVQSDRFQNPGLMVCPPWNGVDTYGRYSSPDGYFTKTAGCNSSDDRVVVENALRPQYMEYVNLDAGGIQGDIYGDMYRNTMPWQQTGATAKALKSLYNVTGSAGFQYGASVYPKCSGSNYQDAQSQVAQQQRMNQSIIEGYRANQARMNSGMGYRQSW